MDGDLNGTISDSDSDDESRKGKDKAESPRFVQFNQYIDMVNSEFKLDIQFDSTDTLKRAIIESAIKEGSEVIC